jgi:viologen exporter family transport system permease protein
MSVEATSTATPDSVPALPEMGRLRSMVDVYRALIKFSAIEQFQYRVATYFWMVGMIAEPVIYLVVWSTIAKAQGGAVGGYTPGDFAAYYIVWTLVRNMNIVFTPLGWEWRIREGQLSAQLLRPLHPIHYDLGEFAGGKLMAILLWLPVGAILTVAFHPTFHLTALKILVFMIAIWGAYLIRSLNQWTMGMITFWTTMIGAIAETWYIAEMLLSGRLVPLSLMPRWVQTLAWFLPFKWTFGYPIEALAGQLSTVQLVGGLAMQALWIAVGALVVRLVWRRGIRRYAAVGG